MRSNGRESREISRRYIARVKHRGRDCVICGGIVTGAGCERVEFTQSLNPDRVGIQMFVQPLFCRFFGCVTHAELNLWET